MKTELAAFICVFFLQTASAVSPCTQAAMEGRSLEGCEGLSPKDLGLPKPDCVPGTSWSPDGCNMCHCNEKGYGACTAKSCGSGTLMCKPGVTWILDECNTCSCSETGVPSCTQKACRSVPLTPEEPPIYRLPRFLPPCMEPSVVSPAFLRMPKFWPPFYDVPVLPLSMGARFSAPPVFLPPFWRTSWSMPPPVKGVSPLEKACFPGQSWFDGCNRCFCNDNGMAACTQKKCEEHSRVRKSLITLSPERCTPGSTWFDGCNHCTCGHDGSPACTYKYCPQI